MERVKDARITLLCDKIGSVTEELAALKSLLLEEEDFFRMLTLDGVDQETRLQWMKNIFTDNISKETLAAFCLLLDGEGMQEFGDVLAKGLKILGSENRTVQGVVYSVVPLGKEAVKRLEAQTSALLRKPVLLTNLIDESLVGGFLVSVDGKLIDASIKKRIEDMSLRIKTNTEGGNLL